MVRIGSWSSGWCDWDVERHSLHRDKLIFGEEDRSSPSNWTLCALRRVVYAVFGSRTKPGIIERLSRLEREQNEGMAEKLSALETAFASQQLQVERLTRVLDGFSVEDVLDAAERLSSVEKVVGARSKRLDKLEADGAKFKAGLLMVAEKLESRIFPENRILNLEKALSDVSTVINNNASVTATSLDNLAVRVTGAETRCKEMEAHVHIEYPSQSSSILGLERKFQKISEGEQTLKRQLGSIRTEWLHRFDERLAQGIDDKLGNFKDGLVSTVDDLQQQVSELYIDMGDRTLNNVASGSNLRGEEIITCHMVSTDVPGLPQCSLNEALERLVNKSGGGNIPGRLATANHRLDMLATDLAETKRTISEVVPKLLEAFRPMLQEAIERINERLVNLERLSPL